LPDIEITSDKMWVDLDLLTENGAVRGAVAAEKSSEMSVRMGPREERFVAAGVTVVG
jgi:hypothetical protein